MCDMLQLVAYVRHASACRDVSRKSPALLRAYFVLFVPFVHFVDRFFTQHKNDPRINTNRVEPRLRAKPKVYGKICHKLGLAGVP